MSTAASKIIRIAAPLRQQVTEVLRNAIHEGIFLPGSKLGERELCEFTGVSRTSVREAIRQLEAEGYVTMVANRGPMVAVIDADEAEGIYQVRAALEGLAARLFTKRATAREKLALGRTVEALEAAVPDEDTQRWLAAIGEFYAILINGTRNLALQQTLRTLQGRTTRLRATSVLSPGRMKASCAEIKTIVAHIERGDEDGAEKAAIEHVRHAAAVALKVIASQDA